MTSLTENQNIQPDCSYYPQNNTSLNTTELISQLLPLLVDCNE